VTTTPKRRSRRDFYGQLLRKLEQEYQAETGMQMPAKLRLKVEDAIWESCWMLSDVPEDNDVFHRAARIGDAWTIGATLTAFGASALVSCIIEFLKEEGAIIVNGQTEATVRRELEAELTRICTHPPSKRGRPLDVFSMLLVECSARWRCSSQP